MPRIPYFDYSQSSPELAAAMKGRPPLNIYRMIAHGDAAAITFLELGRSLLTASAIDPALRELVILRVTTLCGATYEELQHRKVAARIGVPIEKVEAVIANQGEPVQPVGLEKSERAVLRFTDKVVRDVKAPAALFREIAEMLTPRQIVELLMVIGFYMMASRISENLEIDLES